MVQAWKNSHPPSDTNSQATHSFHPLKIFIKYIHTFHCPPLPLPVYLILHLLQDLLSRPSILGHHYGFMAHSQWTSYFYSASLIPPDCPRVIMGTSRIRLCSSQSPFYSSRFPNLPKSLHAGVSSRSGTRPRATRMHPAMRW